MKRAPPVHDKALVLVVEDEPLIRIFTVQVLSEAGFEVDEAGNSEEALSRLKGRKINALVTDVDMPGRLDGCGLAWEVHALCPEAALVIISGVATIVPGELPPKTRFLRKPLAPEKLVAELNQALLAA
jgi:DNA-binding NtrC family response regulator